MVKMIETAALKKIFLINGISIKAVDGVDLSVEKGETVAITGPSGSGKSSLLHMLGLMEKPTSGTLFFAGEDALNMNESLKAGVRNQKIGFVFQFHYLLPEFSLLENMLIPLQISGTAAMTEKGRQRALEMLKNVGLGERLNHTPAQLSGGEQQRAAIVRALINSPVLLLADEPTGNLDVETGMNVLELMFGFARELGAALVIVTHNPDVAARAGRTIRLLNGRIENPLTSKI